MEFDSIRLEYECSELNQEISAVTDEKEAYRQRFHRLINEIYDSTNKGGGPLKGAALKAFLEEKLGIRDVTSFYKWKNGTHASDDVFTLRSLAQLRGCTPGQLVDELFGVEVEEIDSLPKFDGVQLQRAIDHYEQLGKALSAIVPITQVANSVLPNQESMLDTEVLEVSKLTLLSMCAPNLSVYLNRVLHSRGESSSIRDFLQYADCDYVQLIEQAIAGTLPRSAMDGGFLRQLAACVSGYTGVPCTTAMVEAEMKNPPDAQCGVEGSNDRPEISGAMN